MSSEEVGPRGGLGIRFDERVSGDWRLFAVTSP
jgi:hypothetical protein